MRGTGLLRTDPNLYSRLRDYAHLASTAQLPPSCDHRKDLYPVRDQGSSSQCVAFSVACMKEFQEKSKNPYSYSTQFVYDRRQEPTVPGMTIFDAVSILQRDGIALEVTYPFEGTSLLNEEDLANQAKNFRIASYAALYSVGALKAALVEQGVCVMGLPVYDHSPTFWRSNKRPLIGGHGVAVVGYDDSRSSFVLRNSWGRDWGDNGYCYLPYSDWGMIWEAWSSVDGPSDALDPLVKPKKNCCVVC